MQLLEKISFNERDKLYLLGDIIDRGDNSVGCLEYIKSKENIICLLGNHEMMMLDFFASSKSGKLRGEMWLKSGGAETLKQIQQSDIARQLNELLAWLHELQPYVIVFVNGKEYFLSHAGFNATRPRSLEKPIGKQTTWDYACSRYEFIHKPAFKDKHCVFGHTPTCNIRLNPNCSIWIDPVNNDKTCIDCACVYGGALATLRLDDGEVFYVKACGERYTGKLLYIGDDGETHISRK